MASTLTKSKNAKNESRAGDAFVAGYKPVANAPHGAFVNRDPRMN